MNKYVAAVIVLASLSAGAQTTKPTTPAKQTTPAKTAPAAPAKTAPAKPVTPAKTATPAKPATTAPTRHYKVADDAFVSSCSGWAASYSKAPKHSGKLTITGTCTAPSNVRLYLSSRKSSAKGTRNYSLVQSWPLKSKQSTKTASTSVKRVISTNTAPSTVMVGKSSITVSNSAPAAPAPKVAPVKPAPAKPAPAKPTPAKPTK